VGGAKDGVTFGHTSPEAHGAVDESGVDQIWRHRMRGRREAVDLFD